jgi:hypothetical protein
MNTYFHPLRSDLTAYIFREKEFKRDHEIYNCPPDKWAADNGATHTLFIGKRDFHGCGTRPAKLLKTVCYICNEEGDDGKPVWVKWEGNIRATWENVKPSALSEEQMKKWPTL